MANKKAMEKNFLPATRLVPALATLIRTGSLPQYSSGIEVCK
jgi:hypothetical protein